MWPKEFGSQDLKALIEYLLDWLARNLPEQEDKAAFSLTVEKHELAHLAFYQTYPEITRKIEQISEKIENSENLTSEEVDFYHMLTALLETDAILTEENPWLFHCRMVRLLLGLKTLTGAVEDCDNYCYVETMFSSSDGIPYHDYDYDYDYDKAYFYAFCLITFGVQMLDYDPQKNSLWFNPKFMFETDSWEEGQQPTHEQIVRFLQKWEAAQVEMLEAGYESYAQRLPAIRQELTAILQPYLEKLEAELEEKNRTPVDERNLHSDLSNQ